MKKILGSDLGTTSIGWAFVHEDENNEESKIIDVGVRVIPLTVDEQQNFEKGKSITTNANRTLKRGARRNLDRYQLRREFLIISLLKNGFIKESDQLNENKKKSTFETWALRAKSATDKIELSELARVLLHINKKRGYKSSRKAKNEEEGALIDGMEIANKMFEEDLTPGQLVFNLLNQKVKFTPDFYPSDLRAEFQKIYNYQKQFYPDILTTDFLEKIVEKTNINKTFLADHQIYTAENKGKRDEKKFQAYKWRAYAASEKLSIDEVAYVLTEINKDISKTSGYLGKISDRSKSLYFNKQTIGQFVYNELKKNSHYSTANQVFYRQDYMDEFEKIWETQAKFHPILTNDLKREIGKTIIFYQRPLKSQKGLISFCEFEQKEVELNINGKLKKKIIGQRVIPRSSPLFQQYKIWLVLGNLEWKNSKTGEVSKFSLEDKIFLFNELNIKGKLKDNDILKILGQNPKDFKLNYKELEGNETQKTIIAALIKIAVNEGVDPKSAFGLDVESESFEIEKSSFTSLQIVENLKSILDSQGIDSTIINFNPELEKDELFNQSSYQLWHFLYSTDLEGEDLYNKLSLKFGFSKNQARILANCSFIPDYASLSAKAIRKIFPFIKENRYDEACVLAKYRHSKNSLTKEEIEARVLKPKLDAIKRNELRNPVVEKILNQVVNVVNEIIADSSMGRPDEIRIELARELKKNAKEREELTSSINKANKRHEVIIKLLISEFGIKNPSRNDIIRFKLYEELKLNGYKDLYENKVISKDKLFSKEIDVEHIIPKSRLFDDSFSNKTLSWRQFNIEKGEKTAYDFIGEKYGEKGLNEFLSRIDSLFKAGPENGISKAKLLKLQKKATEIGDGFIERDLRESQYIAKKAKSMLFDICKSVISTSGSITDRLREDWGIIDVMQEINFPKYKAIGLTEFKENKEGQRREVIKDWSKRNDHRHHAMDAITIAFTKHSHIQYLNYLNARKNEQHEQHGNIIAIERKELEKRLDNRGQEKRLFKLPMPNFREEVKKHLENTIISIKAKNKVVTRNINSFQTNKGKQTKIELTPRGQLHKETVYGKYIDWEIKEIPINAKLNEELIHLITKPSIKNAILERFNSNEKNSTLAFSGKNAINKNPIVDSNGEVIEKLKIKIPVEKYSIRKEVNETNFKDAKSIDKVLDSKIRKLLLDRLNEFKGNAKEAFANLIETPIWLNKEKGISIKTVKISGVANAISLHDKKDVNGKLIVDKKGNKIATDFVQTGNNHHVAIYRDANGKLQEKVVSFMEAVERNNQNLSIIDYDYKRSEGYEFLFTMKQNEIFVFPNEKSDFDPTQIDLLDPKNYKVIVPNMFRVQKFSVVYYGESAVRDYVFRHIYETTIEDFKELRNTTYIQLKNNQALDGIVKIRINHLGKIVQVGEY